MNEYPDAPLERDRLVLARRKEHLMSEIISLPPASAATPILAPRRWRATRIGFGLAAVAAITTGLLVASTTLGGPSGTGPTAFAIEKLPTGPVKIKVVNTEATAKQMTRQLHDLGYRINIHTVPVSKDLIGRWLGFGSGQADTSPGYDALAAQLRGSLTTLTVPASMTQGLNLDVGRAAHKGEQLGAVGYTNALAPDNPLFCLRLSGAAPKDAAAKLAAAGYTAHWRNTDAGTVSTPLNQQSQLFSSYTTSVPATGLVGIAWIDNPILTPNAGPKDVYLRVFNPANNQYQHWLWTNYPLEQEQSGVRDYSSCPATPN